MEAFGKYIGIQGVLAFLLVGGFVAAPFAGVVLPEPYTEITTFVIGFVFAKNGAAVISRIRTGR